MIERCNELQQYKKKNKRKENIISPMAVKPKHQASMNTTNRNDHTQPTAGFFIFIFIFCYSNSIYPVLFVCSSHFYYHTSDKLLITFGIYWLFVGQLFQYFGSTSQTIARLTNATVDDQFVHLQHFHGICVGHGCYMIYLR